MTVSNTASNAITPIQIADHADIERMLQRLAHQVLETNKGADNLVVIGIVTRGKYLGERMAKLLGQMSQSQVPVGELDITLYRDDASQSIRPTTQSSVPVDLSGKTVLLVDDVLFRARTVRAALDALTDYGRPKSVQLLVLLEREGHRELPIRADYVGKTIETLTQQRVRVCVQEVDGQDAVLLEG
ncbi:MAG: bifunctional pyr operon transcriptional regulator/uracil phosphoribosyltransferase PyrR [Vampirovibrionales bacterium]|nr:bifunctional pyr operon transcriptional regulator/uracil phosphoribosyltransferase PyrR [Vampirovibrionales bacterium]